MVVAGMLGNTVASTAWIRFQPGSRPRRSVWKPRGSCAHRKAAAAVEAAARLGDLEHHRQRHRPEAPRLFAELETSLRTRALAAGFSSARSSRRSLPVAVSFFRQTAMRELCREWMKPCATSRRSCRSRTRKPSGRCSGPKLRPPPG